ncbi:MAG: protein kinase, partial [Acidobacteriota bacterium]|nr:protein kinase [Acidobacteriota bacterium]
KLTSGSDLTRSHTSVGTAAYMSPEQLRSEPVGPQTDIWALGILLFELLTGKRPFRGEYAEALSYSILNEQPMTVGELRPDLPAGVDPIIKRMLRKDPLQRQQTAEDVIVDLETLKTPSSGSSGRKRERIETERLRSGAKLGPYAIVRAIGSGGMGDVYLATDTRLDRQVAIKVLPPEFSEDAERKARFKREAKTISQLHAPNICTLFDIGEQEGLDYLVMEYLEGETLAEMKLPLPIAEVLKIGSQMAEGLAAAHKQGIVHRDLTPANVMITKGGIVKLLDFGLAKNIGAIALGTRDAGDGRPLTGEGLIVGTLAYMSPEQIEGCEADARTDIFAFGAVVYEMFTGKKAFAGKTQASLIGAIMHDTPPPIAATQPLAPAAFERLVRTCLQKDPEERFQSAHDIKLELQWIQQSAADRQPQIVSRRPRSTFLFLPVAVIVSALAAASVVYVHFRNAPRPVVQTSITLPNNVHFNFDQGPVALSPDGTRLAFVATGDGRTLLWVRPLDASAAQPLAGTDGASYPFWSSDSRLIAFFADGKLKKIDPNGGTPEILADATTGRGGAWNRDGVVLFVPSTGDAIMRVSATGGPVTAVTHLDEARGEFSHRWPRFLPDGRRFLYSSLAGSVASSSGMNGSRICVASLDGTEPSRAIVTANSNAAYVKPGFLLYVREGSLRAQRFDIASGGVSGEPVPIVEQIQYNTAAGVANYSATDAGLLSFVAGAGAAKSQLTWFDRAGKPTGTIGAPANLWDPRLSHDGKRVALSVGDVHGAGDLWTYDVGRPLQARFTFDPADDIAPVWSHDDAYVIFTSYRGPGNIFRKVSAGSGSDDAVVTSKLRKVMEDSSPDGDTILYAQSSPRTRWDLIAYSLAEKKAVPFAATEFNEVGGQFSPDGHWVAYVSDESGRNEVYVARFPASAGKWQVSNGGGIMPRWAHSGSEIVYFTGGTLMAARIHLGDTVEIEMPHQLFTVRLRYFPGIVRTQYDVAPDDQRFLINVTSEEQAQTPVTLYQNWIAKMAK